MKTKVRREKKDEKIEKKNGSLKPYWL